MKRDQHDGQGDALDSDVATEEDQQDASHGYRESDCQARRQWNARSHTSSDRGVV